MVNTTANGEHNAAIEIWTGFFKNNPNLYIVQSGLTSALKSLEPRPRIRVLRQLLRDHPNNLYLKESLGQAYALAKDFNQAIPLLTSCLENSSGNHDKRWFENQLVIAFTSNGDFDRAINILNTALDRDPRLRHEIDLKKCQIFKLSGDLDAVVAICVAGLIECPTSSSNFRIVLRNAINSLHHNQNIDIWKELTIEHVEITSFQEELLDVLKASQDRHICVEVLKEVLMIHPNLLEFHTLLQQNLNAEEYIDTWAGLLDKHPSQPDFCKALCLALDTCEDIKRSIQTWTALLITHPNYERFDKELRKARAKSSGVDLDVACTICYDRDMDTVLYKCGHSYCSICVKQLDPKLCPDCRRKIKDVVRVYARLFHK